MTPTPSQLFHREMRDNPALRREIKRAVKDLEKLFDCWHTVDKLHANPRRHLVLAALDDEERAGLDEIYRALGRPDTTEIR